MTITVATMNWRWLESNINIYYHVVAVVVVVARSAVFNDYHYVNRHRLICKEQRKATHKWYLLRTIYRKLLTNWLHFNINCSIYIEIDSDRPICDGNRLNGKTHFVLSTFSIMYEARTRPSLCVAACSCVCVGIDVRRLIDCFCFILNFRFDHRHCYYIGRLTHAWRVARWQWMQSIFSIVICHFNLFCSLATACCVCDDSFGPKTNTICIRYWNWK